MTPFLLNILSSLVIAVATSFITVRISLHRFYVEKWWERRLQAYQAIIYALYDMKRYVDEYLWGFYDWQERQMNSPQNERDRVEERDYRELLNKSKVAEIEINRARAVGDFLVSKKAVQCLQELQSELRDARAYEDLDERLENEAKALGKCLERMRACAIVELKVVNP